jgi:flagellar basal body-associated protein FliL
MPFLKRRQLMLLFCCSSLPAGLFGVPGAAGEEKDGDSKPAFLSLGEFTVNLHDKNTQFGFVVVGVTLDVAPDSANTLRDIMPRLKEALTRRLIVLADRGALAPGATDTEILKVSLAEALQKLNADGIRDVLITRLLYG